MQVQESVAQTLTSLSFAADAKRDPPASKQIALMFSPESFDNEIGLLPLIEKKKIQ